MTHSNVRNRNALARCSVNASNYIGALLPLQPFNGTSHRLATLLIILVGLLFQDALYDLFLFTDFGKLQGPLPNSALAVPGTLHSGALAAARGARAVVNDVSAAARDAHNWRAANGQGCFRVTLWPGASPNGATQVARNAPGFRSDGGQRRPRIMQWQWHVTIPNNTLAIARVCSECALAIARDVSEPRMVVTMGAPKLRRCGGQGRSRITCWQWQVTLLICALILARDAPANWRWARTLPSCALATGVPEWGIAAGQERSRIASWRWPGTFPNGAVAIPNDIPEKHFGDGQGWSQMCLGDCQKCFRTAHGCDICLSRIGFLPRPGALPHYAGNCHGRFRIAR